MYLTRKQKKQRKKQGKENKNQPLLDSNHIGENEWRKDFPPGSNIPAKRGHFVAEKKKRIRNREIHGNDRK